MNQPRLRAIFFDAGNTLIYPRVDELAEDLTAQGYPATEADFDASERAGKHKLDEWLWPQLRAGLLPPRVDRVYWTEYLRALMERTGVPETARVPLMVRLADRFRDITLWSRVQPGTGEFLRSLRERGYYLGVISNSVGTIAEQLERVGLRQHFEIVLDSAIVGVEKPQPQIFHMALETAGAAPSDALFVGDTYATDIGGAELAGLRGVLIDRVGAYNDVPCPRITTVPELGRVLDNLA